MLIAAVLLTVLFLAFIIGILGTIGFAIQKDFQEKQKESRS